MYISTLRGFWGLLCFLCLSATLTAQEATDCDPNADAPVAQGDVIFSYGSTTNAFSFTNRSSHTIGQTMTGNYVGAESIVQHGFWNQFLLPPQAPQVRASQGVFPDRVQISWAVDPLSSQATDGFVVLRDGAYLAEVDRTTTDYIDFNVQAGEFYTYSIAGRNQFGTGTRGNAVGFVNPNGLVTGRITTTSGNPVANATVILEPTDGQSMAFNGVDDYLCVTYSDKLPIERFTLTGWVKLGDGNDKAGIIDLGSDLGDNFWLHTTPAADGKGVVAGVGDNGSSQEIEMLFNDEPDDWHHVAVVYNGSTMVLYLDGVYAQSMAASLDTTAALFTIGSNRMQDSYYNGNLDELRIYDRALTQTDIITTKDITVSSRSEGLVAYWKFDEGLGEFAFDLTANDIDASINGATFDRDDSGVLNAGMTDVTGYYSIEGINYSESQTFQAIAQKNFYNHQSLEFSAANEAYVTLQSFDLADTATVEVSVQPFDLQSRQTILSQEGTFDFFLENETFKLTLNGTTSDLGPADPEFQHIALVMDDAAGTVAYYKNGALVTTLSGQSVATDYSGSPWQLGASGGGTPANFMTGLIDEVAFFNGAVDLPNLQLHASRFVSETTGVNPADSLLVAHYPIDEGSGALTGDFGPQMLADANIINATWSIIAYRQEATPHLFSPSERVVNVNASNTAIGNINFTDQSTVTISGVVYFDGTTCFQDSVQILVDGEPAFPPIYTDSTGRWVGDFEPGASVVLSPMFDDSTHQYAPQSYGFRNVNRPIAGIPYRNLTKRKIAGQVAGGACRLPINFTDNPLRIKVASLNGCFEQELELEHEDGRYSFLGLPPIPLTVSITYHPDNTIYDAFQLAGGQTSDLRRIENDTVDFIYTAPPVVDLQAFEVLAGCPDGGAFIEMSTAKNGYREYKRDVRVYELYKDARCYLDTFDLVIRNEVADQSQYSISVGDTTTYPLFFYAGLPNFTGPPQDGVTPDYSKFIQVTAITQTGSSSDTERVTVLGERSREASFTTAAPAYPMFILRDPPGDGSNATLAKGSEVCQSLTNGSMISVEDNVALNFDLGFKSTTYAGTPFGGVIVETEQIAELDITGSIGESVSTESTVELCVSTDREYSTSDGDAVLGQDADLYVGAAVNFEISTNDVIDYDFENCEFVYDTKVRVAPDGFGTKYVYSEWQLKTDVIPTLELTGDTTSADAWRRLLQYNQDAKDRSEFVENLTFDALNTYTETRTDSKTETSTVTSEFTWTAGMSETIGFEVFSVGSKVTIGFEVGGANTETSETVTTNTTETSFTLADDDPNDNWTIDISSDKIWGTPVFKTRAGETMCPWEPGTLNREQVAFNTDRLDAVNIPANGSAVYNLRLTNDSQTGNDPLIYLLGTVEGSNPDGAIINVDGEGLTEPRAFQILPGETKEILLTVERGPIAYSYSDLGIFMASECMWEHARGLGYDLSDHNVAYDRFGDVIRQGIYDPSDLAKFYKEFRLGVEFLEPCTPIDISFPMQDFVVTPDDNNTLSITLVDYINDDPDLNIVRVQYRPTGGDGSWINIVELPAAEFASDPVFKVIQWDMNELRDGAYDIRAVSECFDLNLNPGISRVIQGRKETRPPALFGTPEPADGVLSPGDEISIQFTKRIRCDEIFQAFGVGTNISLNNLALIDVATGALVDATITCSDDKIIIVPNIANQFIENRTLRVVTNDIEDLYGNTTDEIAWEFYVNRSNLYWAGGSIDEGTPEGTGHIVTREIRNQGGAITSYSLDDVPSWMNVFPREGSLAPGTRQVVTFEFPDDLPSDAYETTLIMTTVDGPEPLDIDLRVVCPPPPWGFNPTDFTFTMSMTLEFDIEGDLSADRLDHVGAFVDGELRGIGYIEYNEELDQNGGNPYMTFLSVYSNTSVGETVEFQIWDASDCILYGATVESFDFVPDGIIGSPENPETLHTTGEVLKKIYFRPGWNWWSYNVDLADVSVNATMSSLSSPGAGMIIKDQTRFSQYTPSADLWFGSLFNTNTQSMFQLRANVVDSISLIGTQTDPTTPIPVFSGWNWIGYLPSQSMTVDDALSSLTPLAGDIVKGQFAFAQYVAGLGWIGNLDFMSSPNGYLLKVSTTEDLIYPERASATGNLTSDEDAEGKLRQRESLAKRMSLPWQVTPENFEHSMNIIAVVHDSLGVNVLSENDAIGAFTADGEVRGVNSVISVPELQAHLVFLTVYANTDGEPLTFKYFNGTSGEVTDLTDDLTFVINQVMGQVESPLPLNLPGGTTVSDYNPEGQDGSDAYLRVYPNPSTGDAIYFNFSAQAREKVQIVIRDILGRQIRQFDYTGNAVENVLQWEPGNLAKGVYVVTLHRAGGLQSRKFEIR